MIKAFFSLFRESQNSFQGQEPGEKIVLFLRRHPFVIIIKIIGLLIAYLIPIIISVILIEFILKNDLFILYLFVLSIWSMIIWLIIFYSLTMYTLDVWIITDHRIVDSNQYYFFNRTVSQLHITKIQDISVKTSGLFQTMINFGDLYIQTAGTEERFKFLEIPKPIEVKNLIMKMASSEGGIGL